MAISIESLLENIPEDPLDALAIMADRIANQPKKLVGSQARLASRVLMKFAEKFEIKLASKADNPTWEDDLQELIDEITVLTAVREQQTVELEIEREIDRLADQRSATPGFAVLTPQEKTAIAQKVETLRQLIDESSLMLKKKNVLLGKLAKFASEAMRDGTLPDTLFAFTGEFAFNVTLMTKNAKHATSELKDILRIVLGNRAVREGMTLPKPEDVLQLPRPKE